MVYEWRNGARLKLDAQVAGEELDRIRERDGKLETAIIVDEARPADAPLHPAFEWNNKTAGEQWRLHQARYLVRALAVRAEEVDGDSAPVFVHVRAVGEESGYYQSVVVAAKNPDERARALAELSAKVNQAVNAFETFSRMSEGESRRTKIRIKKAGAALGEAKAVIAEIAG